MKPHFREMASRSVYKFVSVEEAGIEEVVAEEDIAAPRAVPERAAKRGTERIVLGVGRGS